jgi:CrcB protein
VPSPVICRPRRQGTPRRRFCGAYTTFSTFTFETIRLLEDGRFLEAAGNVTTSVTVGLGAAAGGLAIGLAL